MNGYPYTEKQILKAAIAAYECNRAFSVAMGDRTVVPWEWADELTKKVFIHGIGGFVTEGLLPFAEDANRRDVFRTVVTSVMSSMQAAEEALPGV